VVPNLPQAHDGIRRGLAIICRIATTGNAKAQQSERFVQKLVRATLRRGGKVSVICLVPEISKRRIDLDYLA